MPVEAAMEALWIGSLLTDLGSDAFNNKPIIVFDNSAANSYYEPPNEPGVMKGARSILRLEMPAGAPRGMVRCMFGHQDFLGIRSEGFGNLAQSDKRETESLIKE
ncbi:hypothetical protein Tco_0051947 [Tanacetum coccineum]